MYHKYIASLNNSRDTGYRTKVFITSSNKLPSDKAVVIYEAKASLNMNKQIF